MVKSSCRLLGRKLLGWGRRSFRLLWAGAIVALVILWGGFAGHLWDCAEPLIALWPLALYFIGQRMESQTSGGQSASVSYGLYFLAASVLALPLLLHPRSWKCFEPMRMLYLMLSANVCLWCLPPKPQYACALCVLEELGAQGYDTEAAHRQLSAIAKETHRAQCNARLRWTVWFDLVWLVAMIRQDRISFILTEDFLYWISYRLRAIWGSLRGDLSMIDRHYRRSALLASPLSRIHWMDGALPALGVLALIAAVFFMLRCLLRAMPEDDSCLPLCRGLMGCLLVRSCLGAVADLCLLSASSVQMLLLGDPWELTCIVIIIMLACGREKRNVRKQFRN